MEGEGEGEDQLRPSRRGGVRVQEQKLVMLCVAGSGAARRLEERQWQARAGVSAGFRCHNRQATDK